MVSLGKPSTVEDMYEELRAAQASKEVKLRFASAETAVGSPEQIRKLLRVVDVASAAGCYGQLKQPECRTLP